MWDENRLFFLFYYLLRGLQSFDWYCKKKKKSHKWFWLQQQKKYSSTVTWFFFTFSISRRKTIRHEGGCIEHHSPATTGHVGVRWNLSRFIKPSVFTSRQESTIFLQLLLSLRIGPVINSKNIIIIMTITSYFVHGIFIFGC